MADREQIQALRDIFQKSKNSPKRDDGRISDRKLYNSVGEALIDVGKEKVYELAEEIYPYLNDPFAEFRAEAVRTLGWSSRLGIEEFCKNQAYQIWKQDPDEEVRDAALAAWAGSFRGNRNPEVLLELYNILINSKCSSSIRTTALIGLFKVADAWEKPDGPYSLMKLDDITNQDEYKRAVNWDWVNNVMQKYVPGWEKRN